MVDAIASSEATELTNYPDLSIGLHLELKDLKDVEAELNRQIVKFTAIVGRMPDHIDTHKRHTTDDGIKEVLEEFTKAHKISVRNFNAKHIGSFGINSSDASVEQLKKSIEEHPNASEFVDVARTDRKLWQNMLASHRNALHSGDRRNEKHDPDNPVDARMIFDNVWQAIEEDFAYLGEKVMDEGWTLVHVPEEQRDETIPVRFKPYLKGLLDGSIKLPPLGSSSP